MCECTPGRFTSHWFKFPGSPVPGLMLPYTLYKVVHIIGLALVMSTLGGLAVHAMAGGTRQTNPARGLIGALNGVGFLLILVGGF